MVSLKFSIGYRLFAAVLLSFFTVSLIGVQLVRWRLFENVVEYPTGLEVESLEGLVNGLSKKYRQHQDWSFISSDPSRRKTFLREELLRVEDGQGAKRSTGTSSPTLAYRVGLLDKHERYLAGEVAHPIMVAFASIDTFRRPLIVDGDRIGYLVVIKRQMVDDGLTVAFLVDQQKSLMVIAAVGVLLSALAAAFLAMHFRRPIGKLASAARRLGEGRFETRLNLRRSDELGVLADTFNHLSARLEDVERSRRQWVADTSHELRTPLSVMRAQLESMQDGVRVATPENIAVMLRQILALTKIVDELQELACADEARIQYDKCANDVWRLVIENLDDFSDRFRAAQLVETRGVSPVQSTVYCDADRICQVVTNLLENCVRYTAAGGRIHVSGTVVDSELHISFDDTAPGVPEKSIGRLGERFFRVEVSRSRLHGGAGLGLALCRQIVDAHAGRLEFGVSPLGGLRATVVLELEDAK
jgi:two-component system, OmpR family, sensor histidine kinase BaeS